MAELSEKNRYWREWYANNEESKKKHRERVRKNNKAVRDWAYSLKENKKCKYCPEDNASCLHWHHRNPEEKEFNISDMVARRFSKAKILKEIEKCDLLCANCHLKHHAGLV